MTRPLQSISSDSRENRHVQHINAGRFWRTSRLEPRGEPGGEPLTGVLSLPAGIIEGQSESFLVRRRFGRLVSTEESRTPEEFGSHRYLKSVDGKSRSLTMSAVSSEFLSILSYALIEERHFALVDGLRVSNLGSLRIVRIRNSVRTSHLFDSQRSRFLLFELPHQTMERDAKSLHRFTVKNLTDALPYSDQARKYVKEPTDRPGLVSGQCS